MKKIIAAMMVILTVMSLTIMAQAEANVDFARSIVKTNVNGAVQVDTELQEKADAAFGKGLDIQIKTIEVNGISTGTIKYQPAETDERSWIQKAWDFVTFWD